jgi:hypothetical protein
LSIASIVLLGGCAATAGIRLGDLPQPTVRSGWTNAGVRDQRRAFAAAFCDVYANTSQDLDKRCEDWIWQPPDSELTDARAPLASIVGQRTLVIAPGIFGECVAPWVAPFSSDYAALEALGYHVKVLPLEGRASSKRNARIINAQLSDPSLHLENAVVIAYSKGVTDFMQAASEPSAAAWRGKIAALVSFSGVVNGTPVASHGASLYDKLLRKRPFKTCGGSDGGGVDSLTYTQSMQTTQDFVASRPPFPTYSVLAVATGGPVNPLLSPFQKLLSRIDERNDGQVLIEDAVVPGSTVLGVFRADHWSLTLPFEESSAVQVRPLGHNNHFPRGALIRAVLQFTAPVAPQPTKEQ